MTVITLGPPSTLKVYPVFTFWFLIIGALFVVMALTGTTLKRLPLTTAIIYMAVGFVLGTSVLDVLPVDPMELRSDGWFMDICEVGAQQSLEK